jgi:menaquinone-dependent protoporphyrinogen oxidase
MNKHILVTYATKADSTAEVAKTIALRLEQRGFLVDLENIEQKPTLESYDFIVIGSAIRMGKWLPHAIDFIKNNAAYFNKIPHALFTVHLLNVEEDEVSRTNRLAYLDSIRPWV